MTADAEYSPDQVSPDECHRAFEAIPHLANISATDCHSLAPLMVAHDFPAGTTLFYEDDDSDGAYFISTGAIEIFKSNAEGRKLQLVVLRDGGLLGEIGLLIGEPRTATARALQSVRVLRLSREAFEKSLESGAPASMHLSLAFARVLAQRLTATDEKLFELFQNDVSGELHQQLSDLQARLLTRWTA